jgi:glycerol-3-phosphate dehydrogenase
MRCAVILYEQLSHDRNRGIEDEQRQIPPGHIISREECLRLAPGLDPTGITGGAIWYDGSLSDPARLTLDFVRSAAEMGACVANYVEATGFVRKGSAVTGVNATDVITGDQFSIRGSMVVSATGPWIGTFLSKLGPVAREREIPYIRSVDIVTSALTIENHGLALVGPEPGHPEHLIRYFSAPWCGLSVVGSVDYLEDTDPDEFRMKRSELEHLVEVVRGCMPGIRLTPGDVICVQAGLIPHAGRAPLSDPYNAERHYRIIDHGTRDGAPGLLSVTGIKYTTARDIAEKTAEVIVRMLGRGSNESHSATTPLHSGRIDSFESFLKHALGCPKHGVPDTVIEALVRSHGSSYMEVLLQARDIPTLTEPIAPSSSIIRAQIVHAVRTEMAVKLADVVLRRTQLGSLHHPGLHVLRACAQIMAELLGWGPCRIENEITETDAHLARFWARPGPPPAKGSREQSPPPSLRAAS